MKKWVLAFLIALLVIGVVSFTKLTFVDFDDDENDENGAVSSGNTVPADTTSSGTNSGTTSGTSSIITAQQLSTHSQKSDCWIAYSGKVYDVTSFLPNHKGSSRAIEPYCGTEKEFTAAFLRQHGTSKASLLVRVGVLIGDFGVVGTTN